MKCSESLRLIWAVLRHVVACDAQQRGASSSQPQVKSGSLSLSLPRPYPHKKTHQTTQGMPSGYYIQLRWSEARSRIEYHPLSNICIRRDTGPPFIPLHRIIHISQPSNARRRACYVHRCIQTIHQGHNLKHNDNTLRSLAVEEFYLGFVVELKYHYCSISSI